LIFIVLMLDKFPEMLLREVSSSAPIARWASFNRPLGGLLQFYLAT